MNEFVLPTPCEDYALLDFGEGWRLERFGPVVIQRPSVHAQGPRALADWNQGTAEHWVYDPRWGVSGAWRRAGTPPGETRGQDARGQSVSGQAASEESTGEQAGDALVWQARVGGLDYTLSLGPAGRIGCRPEQQACAQWLSQRLTQGRARAERTLAAQPPLRVLNLFAGPGGVSAAALAAGAVVTHVSMDAVALERARHNLSREFGGVMAVDWQLGDVGQFVEQAIQRHAQYDVILLDPPRFQLTPLGHGWDIQRDLSRLLRRLPGLLSPGCQGVWISLHTDDVQADSVARLLHEAFPARHVELETIGLAAADGRVLTSAVAVHWEAESATAAERPLDVALLEDRLEVLLDAVLSSRRTAAEPARRLAALRRAEQEFILDWVERIAQTNAELAFQLAMHATEAMALLCDAADGTQRRCAARADVEGWILQAMDAFDRSGVHAAITVLQDVRAYANAWRARRVGVAFEDVAGVLAPFVQGLSARSLRLDTAATAYTDTETLYLPPLLALLPAREDNLRLYKALCVWLWAQIRFGSYRRADGEAAIDTVLAAYVDTARAVRCFLALEAIRIDACLARHLPGAQRAAAELRELSGWQLVPPGWEDTAERLRHPDASVADTHALLAARYAAGDDPALPAWAGTVDTVAVIKAQHARLAGERAAFQDWLVSVLIEAGEAGGQRPQADAGDRLGLLREPDAAQPEGFSLSVTLDGQPIAPPAEAQGLMGSILLDLGDIPDDYLVAAGAGGYRMQAGHAGETEEAGAADVWKGTYHEEGAFLYNEWDYKRGDYRKNWCVLREVEVSPQSQGFVQRTLRRHRGLVKSIRRSFEALRGEDRLLKKQPGGDDVDIDALIEAYAEVRAGMEMSERLFLKRQRHERNMAVMFMVDMSGSTKGWINDAERESLVLLCEALEVLGDRYAIYGFSGNTRKKCELFRVKRFDEPYDDAVRSRIAGITPQEYTRMGVTIRHLTRLLTEVEARTRLLITLSDGKPDDFDGYRGEYGIEDTRQALIEAKQQGIHPFCITIDEAARDYLPHMYGAVNYTVIDNVAKLPLRVSDIYRRLTT